MGGEAAGVPVPISITVIIQAAADALSAQNLFLWFRGLQNTTPSYLRGCTVSLHPQHCHSGREALGGGQGPSSLPAGHRLAV